MTTQLTFEDRPLSPEEVAEGFALLLWTIAHLDVDESAGEPCENFK